MPLDRPRAATSSKGWLLTFLRRHPAGPAAVSSLPEGPALRNRAPRPSHGFLGALFGSLALTIGSGAHAGDILRGGTPSAGGGRGSARSGGGGAEAAQSRANAQDSLRRTTQAIHSVKAMQEAA